MDKTQETLELCSTIIQIEKETSNDIGYYDRCFDPKIQVSDHESDEEPATEGYEIEDNEVGENKNEELPVTIPPMSEWCTCGF